MSVFNLILILWSLLIIGSVALSIVAVIAYTKNSFDSSAWARFWIAVSILVIPLSIPTSVITAKYADTYQNTIEIYSLNINNIDSCNSSFQLGLMTENKETFYYFKKISDNGKLVVDKINTSSIQVILSDTDHPCISYTKEKWLDEQILLIIPMDSYIEILK